MNTDDSGPGSLREAITTANATAEVDVISFAKGVRGTITLTSGELSIVNDLIIDGPDSGKVRISGNDASRVFGIYNSETGEPTDVAMNDVTITRGHADDGVGGGILHTGRELSLDDVRLTRNTAVGNGTDDAIGGAIAVTEFGSTLTVVDSVFHRNEVIGAGVDATGGAIWSFGSDINISGSRFTGNTAVGGDDGGSAAGGAIMNLASSLSIEDSSFRLNSAVGGDNGSDGSAFGGAILNVALPAFELLSSVTIQDSQFEHNRAIAGDGNTNFDAGVTVGFAGGGAIQSFDVGASLTIEGSRFAHNRAEAGDHNTGSLETFVSIANGGAIQNVGGSDAMIVNSVIEHNTSLGGDYSTGGFAGVGGGGGINNLFFSTLTVDNSIIRYNQAVGGRGSTFGNGNGGGIANLFFSTTTVIGSHITHNQARGASDAREITNGGGISNFGGGSTLILTGEQSVISHNHAKGGNAALGLGGGISNRDGAVVTAHTVAAVFANHASDDGDDIFGFMFS
jgi:hypothetical protein